MPTQPVHVSSDPVPVSLMLSDDETRNIAMLFEQPALLTAPRRTTAPDRRPVRLQMITLAVGLGTVLAFALQSAI